MRGDCLHYLLYLARKCNLLDSFESSTSEISKELKVSQQTVSRKLRELEDEGLIVRNVTNEGVVVKLSGDGRKLLEEQFALLQNLFQQDMEKVAGSLVKGVGEGKYYVQKYMEQFQSKLGFKPYPGTLNLNVDEKEVIRFMLGLECVEIPGFKTEERTYGSIKCYKVNLEGVEGAIVVPERSVHGNEIIEVIAPVKIDVKDKVELRK